MAERHQMTLTWTGGLETAQRLADLVGPHSCEINPVEGSESVVLTVVVVETDLQQLRDTVDALLVSFDTVESEGVRSD
ncbi:MAG: hypothetical protein P8Q40_01320 [Candidatus Poseidonia sp.]|uniref:hypothetical protein n=1 Tax=Poseidonia sp. TaxID=2666344 RepID=UPI0030C23B15|nr:hypothetical protein [Poseidonia sp.]MDG1552077.1 hypothetical protein [Poseidonia sp.]